MKYNSIPVLLLNFIAVSSYLIMIVQSLSNNNISPTKNIAVVGTGIAALCCARELAKRADSGTTNTKITLCTSRSKMATQMGPKNQSIPKNGKPFFDYGVQYMTGHSKEFTNELQRWEKLGYCTHLDDGQVGTISSSSYIPFEEGGCYVGNGGMGVLITNLLDQSEKEFSSLEILRGFPNQNKKVTGLSKTSEGKWILKTKDGTPTGPFDVVIGAFAQHCLTDPFLLSGGPPARDMLSCLRRVESNQLIVMQVSFKKSLNAPFTAAHVQGEECLSFIANNSRKPHQDTKIRNNVEEFWTLISSASFGEREFNTNKKGYRKIAEKEMLAALQRVLKISENLESYGPNINRINHWEDGVSVNMPPSSPGYLFDENNNLGWCGDFCTDSPNIEGAAHSGWKMAEKVEAYLGADIQTADNNNESSSLPFSVNWIPRTTNMVPTSSSLVDIGQFSHNQEEGSSSMKRLLPHQFTHIKNLVPSSIKGYNKQSGMGAGGRKASGNTRKSNNNRRRQKK